MKAANTPEIDYGSWVPRKLISIPAVLGLAFLVLSTLSAFFLIGAFFFLLIAAYFTYAAYQLSPKGGNLQAKIRDLVFSHLRWDGEGKLLDIGCGNGALAIEAARKYPRAQVTGIDYWGGKWEYSQRDCERNAGIAGVAQRVAFQKASASKLPFAEGAFDAVVSNLVFHEVQDAGNKREVVKEALRVLKKGGVFAFQDLFLVKRIYGSPSELLAAIRGWGVADVHCVNTSRQFIPPALRLPFMLGSIGIIHGRK